ncbi:hypothetical protein ACFQMN_02615 [Halobacillus campisalis]|uniref:Uncharacterized protein n=2 Tax=Halobacillus campisalis TaxID=435909 RepID=A0ABW2K0T2_9BACI|nr:hypothetical protein [Halobacillus campisalis]
MLEDILQRAGDLGYHTIIGGISGDPPKASSFMKSSALHMQAV